MVKKIEGNYDLLGAISKMEEEYEVAECRSLGLLRL